MTDYYTNYPMPQRNKLNKYYIKSISNVSHHIK